MITEAVIVAGGLGTRLRNAIPHLPKCMAPVAGRPFIYYLLKYLQGQGITRFILATGYQSPVIEDYIKENYSDWNISFSIENEQLGTGGAIAKACLHVLGRYAVIANGDTLYEADLKKTATFLQTTAAECLLHLKPLQNTGRYGVVNMNEEQQIISFEEKKACANALINGGLYALDVPLFLSHEMAEKFSFEKDYLEPGVDHKLFFGIKDDAYFIDIGVAEDYERANKELSNEQ